MPFEPHLKQRASGYGAGSRDRLKSWLLGAHFSGPVHIRVVIRAACRCHEGAHLPWDFPICPLCCCNRRQQRRPGGLVPFGKTTGENVRDVFLSQPLTRPKVTITAHFPPRPRQALGDSVYRFSEKKKVSMSNLVTNGGRRIVCYTWSGPGSNGSCLPRECIIRRWTEESEKENNSPLRSRCPILAKKRLRGFTQVR